MFEWAGDARVEAAPGSYMKGALAEKIETTFRAPHHL